jgi:hypothetical protein
MSASTLRMGTLKTRKAFVIRLINRLFHWIGPKTKMSVMYEGRQAKIKIFALVISFSVQHEYSPSCQAVQSLNGRFETFC